MAKDDIFHKMNIGSVIKAVGYADTPAGKKEIARLRPKVRMGGTTSHNGKIDTPSMLAKTQVHHQKNRALHVVGIGHGVVKGPNFLSGHDKDILRTKFGHNRLSGAEKDIGRTTMHAALQAAKRHGSTDSKKAIKDAAKRYR